MRAWFLLKGIRRGDYGDIDIKPEGLEVKPPASMAKKLALPPIYAAFFARGKPFIIPYERIKDLKMVERKPGLLGRKKPFIELEFLDEEGKSQTLTFALSGIMGIKTEETRKHYNEIMSKLPVKK